MIDFSGITGGSSAARLVVFALPKILVAVGTAHLGPVAMACVSEKFDSLNMYTGESK